MVVGLHCVHICGMCVCVCVRVCVCVQRCCRKAVKSSACICGSS